MAIPMKRRLPGGPLGGPDPSLPGIRSREMPSERAETPSSPLVAPRIERRATPSIGVSAQAGPSPSPGGMAPLSPQVPTSLPPGLSIAPQMGPPQGMGQPGTPSIMRRGGGALSGLTGGGLGAPGGGGPEGSDLLETLLALLSRMPGR